VDKCQLNGQWLGEYTGSSTGSIIVNIDERESYYDVEAYLTSKTGPGLVAFLTIPNNATKFHARTEPAQIP
jgi:hypothetical protein